MNTEHLHYVKDPTVKPFVVSEILALQLPSNFPRIIHPVIAVVEEKRPVEYYITATSEPYVSVLQDVCTLSVIELRYYSQVTQVHELEKIISDASNEGFVGDSLFIYIPKGYASRVHETLKIPDSKYASLPIVPRSLARAYLGAHGVITNEINLPFLNIPHEGIYYEKSVLDTYISSVEQKRYSERRNPEPAQQQTEKLPRTYTSRVKTAKHKSRQPRLEKKKPRASLEHEVKSSVQHSQSSAVDYTACTDVDLVERVPIAEQSKPASTKASERRHIALPEFASIDETIRKLLETYKDRPLGSVLCGDAAIGYFVAGNAFPAAEAHMKAVYVLLETGTIPWPLNERSIQKTEHKNYQQGNEKIAEDFRRAYAEYDDSIDGLIALYKAVPRLLRGYIAVVAYGLQDFMKNRGDMLDWEHPVWTEAWRKLNEQLEKNVEATLLLSNLSPQTMLALAQGYNNYFVYSTQARDALLLKYQRFIRVQGNKWARKLHDNCDDITTLAQLGFMRALERYDYTQSNTLLTHAQWWVRATITREFSTEGRTVRLPPYLIENKRNVAKIRKEMTRVLGRYPTRAELEEEVQRMGIPATFLKIIEDAEQVTKLASLQTSIIGSGRREKRLEDVVADESALNPEEEQEQRNIPGVLHMLLDNAELKNTERQALSLRYGIGSGAESMTLTECGREMGLSRERVRQLQKEALRKLKQCAGEHNISFDIPEDDD